MKGERVRSCRAVAQILYLQCIDWSGLIIKLWLRVYKQSFNILIILP